MSFISKLLFAVIALLLGASSATAVVDKYSWSYTSSDLTASGTFMTGGQDSGLLGTGVDIVSINGTSNNSAIHGLISFNFNNNIFYPGGSPYIDQLGFSFNDIANESISIFWSDFYGYSDYIAGNPVSVSASSFIISPQSVSAVPEPQTYAMLLAGLGLIGFTVYRRKSQIV